MIVQDELFKKYPKLKGFAQHGVEFTEETDDQAAGTCPWCHKKLKFWVNKDNRLWDCKVCGLQGNWEQFLECAHIEGRKQFKAVVGRPLSKERGISQQTFRAFGFGWNGIEYTYPVRDMKRIIDLKRYKLGKRGMSTKGGKISGLISPEKRIESKRIWICEGEWDALALYEILKQKKIKEDVYAVCGASNFPKDMLPLFQNKEVVLCFDNDTAGQRGLAKAWDLLVGVSGKQSRLHWPNSLGLKEGYDIRDLYHDNERDAIKTYKSLNKLLMQEAPEGSTGVTISIEGTRAKAEYKDIINPNGKGMTPDKVLREFKKWLIMESGEPLDVMFGSIFANRIEADPFWIFFVAPPGGSKSEFLMTLAESPMIHLEGGLTPHSLISGMDIKGRGDPSLIPKIIDKTLIIKDVTTVLQMPQVHRDEIFGILRDAYDGRCSKAFGNGVQRNYEGMFGVIGGVTEVIDSPIHQASILGERFVKYRIRTRGKITRGKKACFKVLDNLIKKGDMRSALLDVSRRVLDRPITPEMYPSIPTTIKSRLVELAQWVSNMRGFVSRDRYTRIVDMKPTSEIATRLTGQFGILSMGIAIYHGKKKVDEDIYRIVTQVARDTAPPKAELMLRIIYVNRYKDGATTREVADWSHLPEQTCLYALQDLAMLNVLRHDNKKGLWCVNTNMVRIMDDLNLYGMERGWKGTK